MFLFPQKRSRVPSNPSRLVKAEIIERDGSSALSLGALQRKSIASSLNASAIEKEHSQFMELDKDGKAIRRRKNSFLLYRNSKEFNDGDIISSSTSSSIDAMTPNSQTKERNSSSTYEASASSSTYGEECKHDLESTDDFVVPISLFNTRRSREKESKKKGIMRNFRTFLRKSLKLPLDKRHQQWSRYSFGSGELRR